MSRKAGIEIRYYTRRLSVYDLALFVKKKGKKKKRKKKNRNKLEINGERRRDIKRDG